MPAFITHYLYGTDLFKSMSITSMKKLIKKYPGVYRFGLQGPDIFFYNPFCMMQPKNKNIGSLMHEHNVSSFYSHYLRILKTLTPDAGEIAMAYLCGLLAHYTLDSSIHPYVYYRTGYRPDSDIPGKYYFEQHGEIEACIDYHLLNRNKGLKPSKFHSSKTIHLTPKELRIVSYVMSHTIKQAFPDGPYIGASFPGIHVSYLSTKVAAMVLHSNHGYRKKLIYQLEKHILGYHLIAPLINWDGMTDLQDAMNQSHHRWTNPWNSKLTSRQSVDELYEQAKKNYLALLPLLDAFYHCPRHEISDKEKPLLKELGNYSYHSGLVCK